MKSNYFLLLLSVNLFLTLGVVLILSVLLCSELISELFNDAFNLGKLLLAPLSISVTSSILFWLATSLVCSRSFPSGFVKEDFDADVASLKLLWKLISCEVQGGDSEIIRRESQPIGGQYLGHVTTQLTNHRPVRLSSRL